MAKQKRWYNIFWMDERKIVPFEYKGCQQKIKRPPNTERKVYLNDCKYRTYKKRYTIR